MGRPLRIVTYFVLLLAGTIALAVTLQPPDLISAGAGRSAVDARAMSTMLVATRALVREHPDTIVVVGDSSLIEHMTLPPRQTLRDLLDTQTVDANLRIHVLGIRGFDPLAYYLLADELAALGARAVVLVANVQAFSDAWFRNVNIKHPELAAFVYPRRLPQALALPLEDAGITRSSLATMPFLRVLGLMRVPQVLSAYRDRFRARLDGKDPTAPRPLWLPGRPVRAKRPPARAPRPAPDRQPAARRSPVLRLPRAAGRALGSLRRGGGVPRVSAARRRATWRPGTWVSSPFKRVDLYPAHLRDDAPEIRLMGATMRRLTCAGVPTIGLILPIHQQALRLTGAYDRRDVGGAVELIRATIEANGGRVIDLSTVLEREVYFSDAHTHFTAEGNERVAARLLRELPPLLEAMEDHE